MRSNFDRLITEKTLSFINNGSDLPDDVFDKAAGAGAEIKNVCAKVSSELSAEIDEICSLLGVSKRRFLEATFLDAVATAREIMRREGLYEFFKEQEHSQHQGR